MSIAAKMKKETAIVTRKHKFFNGHRGDDLNETVRLQSEKREEWIREVWGERLQGIAEGKSSAPRLASSSVTSFPGRNSVRRPIVA